MCSARRRTRCGSKRVPLSPDDWIDQLLTGVQQPAPRDPRITTRDIQQSQLDRERREHGWGPPPSIARDARSPCNPERTDELQMIRVMEGDAGLARYLARTTDGYVRWMALTIVEARRERHRRRIA